MTVRILQGHAIEMLRGLPAESVHCVVTSPPYYGLRDYGIEPQVWGGQPGVWARVGRCLAGKRPPAILARNRRSWARRQLSPRNLAGDAKYVAMSRRRLADDGGMFTEIAAE